MSRFLEDEDKKYYLAAEAVMKVAHDVENGKVSLSDYIKIRNKEVIDLSDDELRFITSAEKYLDRVLSDACMDLYKRSFNTACTEVEKMDLYRIIINSYERIFIDTENKIWR